MKFNFFDVFKYLLYRKASNEIIRRAGNGLQAFRSHQDLTNEGYELPRISQIFTHLFIWGWVYSLGFISWVIIPIIYNWVIATYIISFIALIASCSNFFPPYLVYKYKPLPQYKPDLRFKSGKRFVGNKMVIDKDSASPMPKKGRVIKFICGSILLLYFLLLGLPAAYYLNKYFREISKESKTINSSTHD